MKLSLVTALLWVAAVIGIDRACEANSIEGVAIMAIVATVAAVLTIHTTNEYFV
jgi:hypothetical protein